MRLSTPLPPSDTVIVIIVAVVVLFQRLIAFLNATEQTCYIDRLEETFSEGYARWQEYEVSVGLDP